MTVGRTAAVVAMFAAITRLRRMGWRLGARLAVVREFKSVRNLHERLRQRATQALACSIIILNQRTVTH